MLKCMLAQASLLARIQSDIKSLSLPAEVFRFRSVKYTPPTFNTKDFNAPDISWQVPSVLPGSSNFNTHQLLIDISQHHAWAVTNGY